MSYPINSASPTDRCKWCGCELPINPAYQYCIDCRCKEDY